MPGFHRLSDIHFLSFPVTPSVALSVCVSLHAPMSTYTFLRAFLRLMDIFTVTRNRGVVTFCSGRAHLNDGPCHSLIGSMGVFVFADE